MTENVKALRQPGALADRFRRSLLTADELDSIPPPTWLIEDFLVANSVAVLYGQPGCGKSFIALDWTLSVGTGTDWLNRTVQKGDVLYIAAEGAAGMAARKRAWETDRGVTASGTWFLPEAVSLLAEESADALTTVVEELQPVLIVIDTLSRSMAGGDENGPRDMGMVIANIDRLRACTQAAILVVHHTPKDGGSLRGHSSLHGAVQTAIECKSSEGGAMELSVDKQKDHADGQRLSLRRVVVGESCVIHSHESSGSSAPTIDSEIRLLRTARECCGSDGLSSGKLQDLAEMPNGTYFRARKALVDRGALVNVSSEKQPRYVPGEGVGSE